MNLLVAFLIFLLVVCLITYLVSFILAKIGSPIPPNFAWAVAGVIILIWVLAHLQALMHLAG